MERGSQTSSYCCIQHINASRFGGCDVEWKKRKQCTGMNKNTNVPAHAHACKWMATVQSGRKGGRSFDYSEHRGCR